METRSHRPRRAATTVVSMVCTMSVLLAGTAPASGAVEGAEGEQARKTIALAHASVGLSPHDPEDRAGAGAPGRAWGGARAHVRASAGGVGVATGSGRAGLEILLPDDADVGSLTTLSDGTIVAEGGHADYAVQVGSDGSVRAHAILNGASAPTEHRYELDLAPGEKAVAARDGGVDVVRDLGDGGPPVLVGRFEPAWAVDAAGTPVATRYELGADSLVQIVDAAPGTEYPVVADPFWVPAIIIAIRVAAVVVKVGSKTVRYTKAPASRVVGALNSFRALSYRAGSHTFRLDKRMMKHILVRHHPRYWDGSVKTPQSFFNPSMRVGDVRNLVHQAMKQHRIMLAANGIKGRISVGGTVSGVRYKMVIDRGRVVQFYPR